MSARLLAAAAITAFALVGPVWAVPPTGAAATALDPIPVPPVPGGEDDPYLEQPDEPEQQGRRDRR
ncbi:hypothetical protein [Nonomuraea sp. NPDC049309]|jgi:hypothetical protein|uniref:hypothetical protein n=1 Tax=Nonomuraea sp. NPDC049309 TaxID=3364350 RepID=UPI00371935A6